MIRNLFALMAVGTAVLAAQPGTQRGEERIAREVRHELVMLPYYTEFDNLTYRVDGPKVTLSGSVANSEGRGGLSSRAFNAFDVKPRTR